jgi:hypothetical protein
MPIYAHFLGFSQRGRAANLHESSNRRAQAKPNRCAARSTWPSAARRKVSGNELANESANVFARHLFVNEPLDEFIRRGGFRGVKASGEVLIVIAHRKREVQWR